MCVYVCMYIQKKTRTIEFLFGHRTCIHTYIHTYITYIHQYIHMSIHTYIHTYVTMCRSKSFSVTVKRLTRQKQDFPAIRSGWKNHCMCGTFWIGFAGAVLVCMYVCTCIYMYIFCRCGVGMYVCTCIHIYILEQLAGSPSNNLRFHPFVHLYIHPYIYVYIYIYIYISMCAPIHK